MSLTARLGKLETKLSLRSQGVVRVYWDDELQRCVVHTHCDVEIATGEHHQNVIHLSFGKAEI